MLLEGRIQMNHVQKIQHIRHLECEKIKLERELNLINRGIEELENNCLHICIEDEKLNSDMNPKYRCLLCGKKENECDAKYIVHTDNLFRDNDSMHFDNDFDLVQTMMLGILRRNPQMSREEIVRRMNALYHYDDSVEKISQGPNLVKKV